MKCPYCEGTGITKMPTFDDKMSVFEEVCIRCNGTGKIEKTNEEWLKSLNTQELAKWIRQKTHGNNKYNEEVELAWEKWLKAKHHE